MMLPPLVSHNQSRCRYSSRGWIYDAPAHKRGCSVSSMTARQYRGACCPFCRSRNIEFADDVDPMFRETHCLDCEREWYEEFDLVGYYRG